MESIKEMIHRIGFWFLVIFIAGTICGGYGIYCYNKYQLSEATIIGAFVFNKQVYEVKLRP